MNVFSRTLTERMMMRPPKLVVEAVVLLLHVAGVEVVVEPELVDSSAT